MRSGAPGRLRQLAHTPVQSAARVQAGRVALAHRIHTTDDHQSDPSPDLDARGRRRMKLTTRRDALFGQLQTVTRAASTRSAVQALSGVQLLASQDGIEMRATDMEIGLRV